MITPPSSPGVGTVRHDWPAGLLRPNTKDHYQGNTSYNTVYVAAVCPAGSYSQAIGGETSGHIMQVEAGESDDGAQGYRHSKPSSRNGGSKVTGRFARRLVPSYLQSRVEYEGGNYTQ